VCQECFFCSLVLVRHFALSQAASVAILPSALFMSDFSLGASWAFVSSRQARRCGIHHCDLLKPRAKTTSYNQHCRPAQDSACLWHLRDAGLYVFACEVGGVHPALIEAMAAQMPVLYLDTPENRETAGEGGMPFGSDSADLAAGISRLLVDANLRQELGRKAQERAAKAFGWEETTQKYESLFSELVPKNGRPRSGK